jgi:predicted KAP-like P-loop ATPase
MINWGLLFSRLFGMLISWMQATNLRNQVYALKEENEILRIALDDIERISSSRVGVSERHRLIKNICENTRNYES